MARRRPALTRFTDEQLARYEREGKASVDSFREAMLANPVKVRPHDAEITSNVRKYTRQHRDKAIVRFFFRQDRSSSEKTLGAFVVHQGQIRLVSRLNWERVKADTEQMLDVEPSTRPFVIPTADYCQRLWQDLFQPIWSTLSCSDDKLRELVIIPQDELFRVPLHVAMDPCENLPLCVRVPLVFSVSATAYLTQQRNSKRSFPVTESDTLCFLAEVDDEGVSAGEVVGIQWPSQHFYLCGDAPVGTPPFQRIGNARITRASFRSIAERQPDFFVIATHGAYHPRLRAVGPALTFHKSDLRVFQFDIARHVKLPGNKLTVLAACVTGQGADLAGGEVHGFVRAFMAAGCGALGVTLWSVDDEFVSNTVRHLLNESRRAARMGRDFDVAMALHEYYGQNVQMESDLNKRVDRCPLAIYL